MQYILSRALRVSGGSDLNTKEKHLGMQSFFSSIWSSFLLNSSSLRQFNQIYVEKNPENNNFQPCGEEKRDTI